MINKKYNPQEIEIKLQKQWDENQVFEVKEDAQKEKFYCLSMFPYPSGNLHMGHVRIFTISDVITRYQKMLGKNVLQPMGFDAFGLPAENAAIQHGIAPAKWTYQNIAQMKAQFKRLGYGYDWMREVITCKPEYYRWEQWLFTKMYEKGLVYRKNSLVNWDPVDQTVLANEQVIDGRGWRSDALVEQREVPQWFFKITAYAEELLNDLDQLTGWPERVRVMQRNWIGRSEGLEIHFKVKEEGSTLKVYTTRPDTLFGITFMAVASQHPLAKKAADRDNKIQKFIDKCQHTKIAEADLATLEKEGIDSGFKAIHPITGQEIPVWITNYVLMEYGHGAVMAVPAHDQRDYEFAKKYHLPIKQVIQPAGKEPIDLAKQAYIEKGLLIHSGDFSGMDFTQAFDALDRYLKKRDLGGKQINYRLRDWGISRQRYWGAPIPMIYCCKCGEVPVPEKDLPVVLPEDVHFEGVTSPLPKMPEFYEVNCPKCGQKAQRETDTFDTFVESSWYYARYACPDQHHKMLDDRAHYWLPIDQYSGGIEHAVMHLLYIRFFHKVFRDFGLVKSDEPADRLLTQGMVLKDGSKMSKSKGNVVDPLDLIKRFGADTVRTFMMFASPPEQALEWSDSGVEGVYRFLNRIWKFVAEHQSWLIDFNKDLSHMNWEKFSFQFKEKRREVHELLQQANFDMERQQYNTVVAACMKLVNLLYDIDSILGGDDSERKAVICEAVSILLRLLNPVAPHITEYLWQELRYGKSLLDMTCPRVDPRALKSDIVELVVQVNGKLRSRVVVARDADRISIEAAAVGDVRVRKFIDGRCIRKVVVVPGRLVNIVV
ncbi:MAG: leucine--tRNA ligase [Gammaproteobacteria bacterium]|nr:leucine--tRNA ligase [Gammaproteobacteria bacterium]